jgi:ElaB/YqjD/DUF883 family membrane-anchored ribosome-binding protein
LSSRPRNAADISGDSFDSHKAQLLKDLKIVVADAEQLLKEANATSATGLTAVRARFEAQLTETRAKIDQMKVTVSEQTKQAATASQAYVKENPWEIAAYAAAGGLVLGLLLRQRWTAFNTGSIE